MTAPMLDVRVAWRDDGFNFCTNDSFLADTSGWAVTAGINAAGTSITRGTGDGVLGDVTTNTCAELVTTATSGSGANFDFGTRTFTSGRTYRLVAWMKQTAGSTSARLRLGSLGTGADRGDSSVTVTASWARYSVDWTPSADRTDVEAAITNGSAATLTVRLCLVEVFEAIDDIGPYGAGDVDAATWTRGANFDGSAESPGTATIGVVNSDLRYMPHYAAGPLYGLLIPGRYIWVRAVYDGLVYGCWYGIIRRYVIHADLEDQRAEFVCEDMLSLLDRTAVSVSNSLTRSIRSLRDAVLTAAGLGTGLSPARTSLAYGVESAIPFSGAYEASALALLAECNRSTGSIHYIDPQPTALVPYLYTTIDRVSLASTASVESFLATAGEGFHFVYGDVTDELWINHQTVYPTISRLDLEDTDLLEFNDVPFTVPEASTLVFDASRPPISGDLDIISSPTFVAGDVAWNDTTITQAVTAISYPAVVTAVTLVGKGVTQRTGVAQTSTTGDGDRRGEPITGLYVNSYAAAKGLATAITYRYGAAKMRGTLTVADRPVTHLQRDIGDRIALTLGLTSMSATEFLVRSITTTVSGNGLWWQSALEVEEAPAVGNWFTLGGTADQGVGGTAILAY